MQHQAPVSTNMKLEITAMREVFASLPDAIDVYDRFMQIDDDFEDIESLGYQPHEVYEFDYVSKLQDIIKDRLDFAKKVVNAAIAA